MILKSFIFNSTFVCFESSVFLTNLRTRSLVSSNKRKKKDYSVFLKQLTEKKLTFTLISINKYDVILGEHIFY